MTLPLFDLGPDPPIDTRNLIISKNIDLPAAPCHEGVVRSSSAPGLSPLTGPRIFLGANDRVICEGDLGKNKAKS